MAIHINAQVPAAIGWRSVNQRMQSNTGASALPIVALSFCECSVSTKKVPCIIIHGNFLVRLLGPWAAKHSTVSPCIVPWRWRISYREYRGGEEGANPCPKGRIRRSGCTSDGLAATKAASRLSSAAAVRSNQTQEILSTLPTTPSPSAGRRSELHFAEPSFLASAPTTAHAPL